MESKLLSLLVIPEELGTMPKNILSLDNLPLMELLKRKDLKNIKPLLLVILLEIH